MDTFPPLFNGVGPVLFGIAVLCAVRIVSQPGQSMTSDPVRLALTVTGWVLILAGLFNGMLMLIGVVLAPLGLIVLAAMLHRRRRAQRYALLWTLTVSAERLMPLEPALEAFAVEGRGVLGSRARRLANLLRAGWRLPDAVDYCAGLIPRDAALTIRVGQESGMLAESLREAVEYQADYDELWDQIASRIGYVLALLTFALGIVIFVMLIIVPQFQKIFADFGQQLPGITQLLIDASAAVAQAGVLFVLVLLAMAGIALLAVLRYMGWTAGALPIFDALGGRLHAAAILRNLALVAQQARPLPAGIATMAQRYPAPLIRRRLRHALDDVLAGRHWCESLAARRLITRADLAVLSAAERVGNLAWALREMADSSQRRLLYRVQAATRLLFPLVIVAFGLLEFLFVAGVFMPLITLIQHCVTM